MDIGQGFAQMGAGIADAMGDYHKEHEKYDQQLELATALSRLGIDEHGTPTPLLDAEGKPKKNVQQLIDPKAFDLYKNANAQNRAKATGALEALSKMAIHGAQTIQSAQIEDQSLSGQATKQRMEQSRQSFPLEQQAREDTHKHMQKLDEEAGKVQVPGFGPMTPAQFSAHTARQERLKVLEQKSEPIRKFENDLQTNYGFGIKDVIDASKPRPFKGGEKGAQSYNGTAYVDVNGTQVSAEDAKKDPEGTFVLVGENKTPIPLVNKKTGLGWQQIIGKAQNFSNKLDTLQQDQTKLTGQNQQIQAQQIMATLKGKDPSQFTPEDTTAFQWAQGILGQ